MRSLLVLLFLACASTAAAQSTGEIWGNVTIDWLASDRLVLSLDVEPKVQVTDPTTPSRFANVEVWPGVAFAATNWLDLQGEFIAGFSNEQDGSNTTEIAERMGVRLHVLSRLIQARDSRRGVEREAQPRRRGTIATLLRFEHRDLSHSDAATTASWRFRDRLEAAFPLNRSKLTMDGAVYLTSDAELFVPLGSADPQHGRVTEWRLRNGLGYRASFKMRLEALYIWTTKKNRESGQFATDSRAIDFRVKLAF